MCANFTRILFATDVHGSDPVWKKFIRGADRYKADVLIIGGDITGKNVKNKEELHRFEDKVCTTGTYIYVGSASEMAELAVDKSRDLRRFFKTQCS